MYETGLTYNAKGDVRWGNDLPALFIAQDIVSAPSAPSGTVACYWYFNQSISPTISARYAFVTDRASGPAVTWGSWVDFGTVAGDENFLNPPRYEINITYNQGSRRNIMAYAGPLTSSLVDTGFNDMNPNPNAPQLYFLVPSSAIDPLQWPDGAGGQFTVTIREKFNPSNAGTAVVDLSVVRNIASITP